MRSQLNHVKFASTAETQAGITFQEVVELAPVIHIPTVLLSTAHLSEEEFDLFVKAVNALSVVVQQLTGGDPDEYLGNVTLAEARISMYEHCAHLEQILARVWDQATTN